MWILVGVGAVALVAVLMLTRSQGGAGPTLTAPGARPPASDDVVALLRAGNKIEAIKRYRQVTGLGLKDAKDAIDALPLGETPPGAPAAPAAASTVSDADIERELRAGNKIGAIKLYREKTGLGLKEAKDAVEAMTLGPAPAAAAAPSPTPAAADADIERELRAGNLIGAIKLYRETHGTGLKEAKDAVEAWRDRIGAG